MNSCYEEEVSEEGERGRLLAGGGEASIGFLCERSIPSRAATVLLSSFLHGYNLRGSVSGPLMLSKGYFNGSDSELSRMLNAAELLERNFGVQFPEELDGTIDLQTGSANCCKFNRWGTLVAVGATDGRVYIFDFLTRGIVKTWNAHSLPITSLSWSRDGRRLLTAAADNNLMVWEVLTATKLHSIKYHHMITFAMFNPRNDKQALVLQINNNPPLLQIFGNAPYQKAIVSDVPLLSSEDSVQSVAYDRKGKYIITGTNKGKLIIYDANTLKLITWCKQNSSQCIKQIFVPIKCNSVLTNSADRVIRAYSFEDLVSCHKGATVEARHKVQDMVNKAAWRAVTTDSDGYYICGATTKSHSLYVWDGSSGALIKILHGTKGETLNDVQWHPTRPVILSIAAGIISVWTQAHVENWSAFAPDFTELDENVKYAEKEGEFDLYDEDADEEEKKLDQDLDVEIDVVHLKPEEMMCSSDEEEMCDMLPDVTLKTGPLWFLPIAPDLDGPEATYDSSHDSLKAERNEAIAMEDEDRKPGTSSSRDKPFLQPPKAKKPKFS